MLKKFQIAQNNYCQTRTRNFPTYQNSFQKLFKPVVHRERTNKNLFAIYSCVVAYLAGMESRRARMAICQDI